jgi:hypothetical protein
MYLCVYMYITYTYMYVYVCIHDKILLSHEENGIMLFPGKWMDLEDIMLIYLRQDTKDNGWMFYYVEERSKCKYKY